MHKYFHNHLKILQNHYIVLCLLYLFVLFLQLFHIGFTIRNGYEIGATLDFSWNSDSVARLLHGYLAGRDFIFTYGPLFQILKSIPSILFSVPAYGSILLTPLVFQSLLFLLTYYLARLIASNKSEALGLFLFLFFVVGLSANTIYEQIVRILPIILYSVLFYRYIFQQKKLQYFPLILISFLPTFFGLYTYDLFIQCLLLTIIYFTCALYFYKTKKVKPVHETLAVILILLFQLITSFALTGNLLYIRASLDTVSNYFSIMNIPWAYGTSNLYFLFPLVLPFLFFTAMKLKTLSSFQKKILFVLMMTALIQLRTTLIRSDEGHIIMGIYPSIIVDFILLFYLLKEKFSVFIITFSILFILIPFKVTFDQALSPKNILYTIKFIQHPSSFLSTFTLPKQYAFTKEDIQNFIPLLVKNPGQVFVYPYDSYLLNVVNQTYNSYALQLYDYSDSLTEEKTVQEFEKNPPKYIIMAIDGQAALALDDIPNLTRNPLVAKFLLENYRVEKQTPRYLILRYDPKKQQTTPITNSCTIKQITFQPPSENILSEGFSRFVKSNLYYLQMKGTLIRLPYKPKTSSYLVFSSYDSKTLAPLFSQKINWENPQENTRRQEMGILKQFPFAKSKTAYKSDEVDLKVFCLN